MAMYRVTASCYCMDVQAESVNDAAERFVEKRYPSASRNLTRRSLLRDPDDDLASWAIFEWRDGEPIKTVRGITIDRLEATSQERPTPTTGVRLSIASDTPNRAGV